LSPFSTKVRIVLAEKGIAADIAESPWSRATLWGPKPQEFLEASHQGEVPALVVDGQAIVDSTVINEYLEDAFPEPALMPADPLGRAECRMWEDMADQFMAGQITTLISEIFLKADGVGRDDEVVAAVHEVFGGYLAAMDRRFGNHDYLCDDYSSADIATWLCLAFAQTLGISIDQYSGVQAWFARVHERPVVAAEYQQIMAAAAGA
jgi:glutathione S-transferase